MKKVRRLITDPLTKKLTMATLYEYHAKVGTAGSSMVWLLEKAKKGASVFGFCMEDRYTPYMGGHAFRYAEAVRLFITDIQFRENYDFLIITK